MKKSYLLTITIQLILAPSSLAVFATAEAPESPGALYTGAVIPSAVRGEEITPVGWVHADLNDANGEALTLVLLYERQGTGTDAVQTKIDTITLPVGGSGKFSGSYGDFESVSGTLQGGRLTFSATVSNGPGDPVDKLAGVELDELGPVRMAPPARSYPMTQVLPVSLTEDVTYSDLWDVDLEVVWSDGSPSARVRFSGTEGVFEAGPVPVQSGSLSFGGTARASGEKATIEFAGTFLSLDGATGLPIFPLLTQVKVEGRSASLLSTAAGINPIFWLEESSRNPSGVVLNRASYATYLEAESALDALRARKGVVSADTNDPITGATNAPNDVYFNRQYPYPVMDSQLCCTGGIAPTLAADAWGVAGATGAGIEVATLDSGAWAAHPDLNGRILGGHNSLRWPWWIDWLRLLIPANWRTDSRDLHGHGTGVAGVVTAIRNNNQGIAGTAEAPQIIPVRVLNQRIRGTDAGLAEGIQWLLDNNLADILNISLISPNFDPSVSELIRRTIDSGRLVFAGSGNSGQPLIPSPAGLPDVVSVGSWMPPNDEAGSGFGVNLSLLAPGGGFGSDLTVTWQHGLCGDLVAIGVQDYCLKTGSSFASPFAAAVASMLLTTQPNLQRTSVHCLANPKGCIAEVTSILQGTGAVVPTPDWAPAVTHVRKIQAHTALTAAAPDLPPPAGLLQTPGCLPANCAGAGLRLDWVAAAPAPGGLVFQAYLIYRNGALLRVAGTPNPIFVVGIFFYDTDLPMNGGAPVAGTYRYTVTALYRDANNVYRESASTNHLRVICDPLTGCG